MVIRLRGRGCWATVAGQGSSARIDCFRCGRRPVGGDRKDFASLDGSVVNHRTAKECGEEDILRKRSPSFRFGPEGGGRLIVLFFFFLLSCFFFSSIWAFFILLLLRSKRTHPTGRMHAVSRKCQHSRPSSFPAHQLGHCVESLGWKRSDPTGSCLTTTGIEALGADVRDLFYFSTSPATSAPALSVAHLHALAASALFASDTWRHRKADREEVRLTDEK